MRLIQTSIRSRNCKVKFAYPSLNEKDQIRFNGASKFSRLAVKCYRGRRVLILRTVMCLVRVMLLGILSVRTIKKRNEMPVVEERERDRYVHFLSYSSLILLSGKLERKTPRAGRAVSLIDRPSEHTRREASAISRASGSEPAANERERRFVRGRRKGNTENNVETVLSVGV